MIYYQYLIRPRDVNAEFFAEFVNERIKSAGLGLFYQTDGVQAQSAVLAEVVDELAGYIPQIRDIVEIILTEGEFDE